MWASEIEPFPIRVTRKHFPHMKHLGDIRHINGAEIEPVDIITGGSPCVSLSPAGDKKGLEGKHSSLFFEMIRVIKEMREATHGKYPRYTVFENVRGALSRHKGDDFYRIIQSFCETADCNIPSARPDVWKSAGCVLGRSYSFAWRVFNSQFWGVPQIRRRVYAVGCYKSQSGGGGVIHTLLQKYSLSRKTVLFILRMVKRKRRTLPDVVRIALMKVLEQTA